jgi:hypothetical protein
VLALCALICFVIALFGGHIGSISLVTLGLCFIAAHLLFGGGWTPWRGRSG